MFKNIGTAGSVYSALLGGVVFILFFVFLNTHWLISLVLGALGFIGGLFIAIPIKQLGVNKQLVSKTISESQEKIIQMQKILRTIESRSVRSIGAEIIQVIEKILDLCQKTPNKVLNAHPFLTYHLNATYNILLKYATLMDQDAKSDKINASLRKVEAVLGTIKDSFEKEHAALLADEVLDLDTEISTLEDSINFELGEIRDEK